MHIGPHNRATGGCPVRYVLAWPIAHFLRRGVGQVWQAEGRDGEGEGGGG